MTSREIKDGGPAFPQSFERDVGLSIRDYFAAQALSGLCSNDVGGLNRNPANAARDAFAYADAMLRERAQNNDETLLNVLSCLLDHYLSNYDGGKDALAILAELFVPDWKLRSDDFNPADALLKARSEKEE